MSYDKRGHIMTRACYKHCYFQLRKQIKTKEKIHKKTNTQTHNTSPSSTLATERKHIYTYGGAEERYICRSAVGNDELVGNRRTHEILSQ